MRIAPEGLFEITSLLTVIEQLNKVIQHIDNNRPGPVYSTVKYVPTNFNEIQFERQIYLDAIRAQIHRYEEKIASYGIEIIKEPKNETRTQPGAD